MGRLESVPAGVLFRVCDRKARVRNMGVRRGSWGFGEEERVLIVGEPANATDRRFLSVRQDWSVKASRGKEEREKAEMETEMEKGRRRVF